MTVLTNQAVATLFDAAADEYDRASNPYTVRRRVDELAARARGDCLELGGGTGRIAEALRGARSVIHSDIAVGMCRVARRQRGLRSICFDAEAIPFADASFDTVIASEMIYYLAEPRRCLTEARRVLRPGGRLLICTTNPLAAAWEKGRTLLRRLGFSQMFLDDGSPRFLTRGRMHGMLTEAGFSRVQSRYILPLPFGFCDRLNRLLERTPAARMGLFLLMEATAAKSVPLGECPAPLKASPN